MSVRGPDPGFFVGYFTTAPPAVRRFSLAFAVGLVAALAGAAIALAVSPEHPGSGGYINELQDGHLTGVLQTRPYPVLRIPASNGRPAHAVMLAGQIKTGVQSAAAALDGATVEAGGVLVRRGDLDMLLIGGPVGLRASAHAASISVPSVPEFLGRWRIVGEICDGKCAAGAMRPGKGLSHKACANLCIIGGVPPVFVSTVPVEGAGFLLLADADGGPLPTRYLARTGERIAVEGEIERRDDLLILKVDEVVP